jgi:transcriptional repressor NF-X1
MALNNADASATPSLNSSDAISQTHPEQLGETRRKPQNRPGRNRPPQTSDNASPVDRSVNSNSVNWRRNQRREDPVASGATAGAGPIDNSGKQNARRRNQPRLPNRDRPIASEGHSHPPSDLGTTAADGAGGNSHRAPRNQPHRSNRRANFNASLTEPSVMVSVPQASRRPERSRPPAPQKDDLTSTLIHAISTPPYPDCLICFSAIYPGQPTWSCSLSMPVVREQEERLDAAQCCWTTFHLKCIRSWAAKSVKEVSEAWRARGEDRKGEWRCPGCRTERDLVPNEYWYELASLLLRVLSFKFVLNVGVSVARPRNRSRHDWRPRIRAPVSALALASVVTHALCRVIRDHAHPVRLPSLSHATVVGES